MSEMKVMRSKVVFDSNIEKINPLFSKVKIRIAYTGINRNNSYISKESFEKAIPTIYNCPIIGEFIETAEDWGTHGGKIEISDKGVKYIQTTKPYGVINENSEITWEDVVEEDGTINTYLCATGYLWTGRYSEAETVIESSKSQSMEIEIAKGEFKNIGGQNVYDIGEFIFSAFCVLGGSVEPCFESSEVKAYTLDKDSFKAEFTEMLNELKQSISQDMEKSNFDINNNKEGGNDLVNEKLELITKYNLTVEQLDFNVDEFSLEELEIKLKEFEVAKSKPEVLFSATYKQKREALNNAMDNSTVKDDNGQLVEETFYYVEDFDDQFVFVEKNYWLNGDYDSTYGRFSYTFDETTMTATVTSAFELMIRVWLTPEENQTIENERATATATYEQLKGEFDEYKNKYSILDTEVEVLKTYQQTKEAEIRTEAETSLFTQFDEKLAGNEEYEALKKTASTFELNILEKECFAILGRKTANFTVKVIAPKSKVKIEFSKKDEGKTDDERDSLFSKYLKK